MRCIEIEGQDMERQEKRGEEKEDLFPVAHLHVDTIVGKAEVKVVGCPSRGLHTS